MKHLAETAQSRKMTGRRDFLKTAGFGAAVFANDLFGGVSANALGIANDLFITNKLPPKRLGQRYRRNAAYQRSAETTFYNFETNEGRINRCRAVKI